MRRSRYRWKAGALSWTPRTGSDDIKKYLDNLLPDECKAKNSTRGFRELKRSEIKLMTSLNRGKHLERAGNRSLTDQQRQKVDANFWKSVRAALSQEMEVEGSDDSSTEIKESEDEEIEDDKSEEYHGTRGYGIEDQDAEDQDTAEDLDTGNLATGYQGTEVFLKQSLLLDQSEEAVFEHTRLRDYRFVQPTTSKDIKIVFEAMKSARKDYRSITGERAPDTVQHADYATQWNCLQMSLNRLWEDRGLGQSQLILVQYVQPWTGGFPLINEEEQSENYWD